MCLRFCDFWIALLTFTWEQFSAGRSLTGMSYLATWPIWHNHWLCQLCMMTLSTFASHLMCSPVSSILCIDNFVIVKGSYLFCGALFEPRPHPKKGLVSSVWMNVLGHDESKIRTFNDDIYIYIYIYYTCMYIMYIYIYTHVGIPSHRKVHALQTHTHTQTQIHPWSSIHIVTSLTSIDCVTPYMSSIVSKASLSNFSLQVPAGNLLAQKTPNLHNHISSPFLRISIDIVI